jgi:transcriptional regulator with XRE-family HTH domain
MEMLANVESNVNSKVKPIKISKIVSSSKLGIKIIELLRANGMRQIDLANDLGKSTGLVSAWIRGEKIPTLKNLVLIAGRLGVSVDELAACCDTDKSSKRVDSVSPQHIQLPFPQHAAESPAFPPISDPKIADWAENAMEKAMIDAKLNARRKAAKARVEPTSIVRPDIQTKTPQKTDTLTFKRDTLEKVNISSGFTFYEKAICMLLSVSVKGGCDFDVALDAAIRNTETLMRIYEANDGNSDNNTQFTVFFQLFAIHYPVILDVARAANAAMDEANQVCGAIKKARSKYNLI